MPERDADGRPVRDAGPISVIKIGGSLLDLPGLPTRLAGWIDAELGGRTAIVVGGGEIADAVRRFDAAHGLGDVTGHWMAVRAMALNTALVGSCLPGLELVGTPDEAHAAWGRGAAVLVQPVDWLRADEAAGRGVPHHWQFTSDSIAAHVARRLSADRLVLAKSVLPDTDDIGSVAAEGVVDPCFEKACAGIPVIDIVNLRADDTSVRRLTGGEG